MRQKDYYIILGVTRSESTEGIKAAFRKLAKKHHPDKSGARSTRVFQEIIEAYETLSHPESRRKYNEQLSREEARPYGEHTPMGHRRAAYGRMHRFSGGFGSDRRRSLYDMMDELLAEMFRDSASVYSDARDAFRGTLNPLRPGEVDLELILSAREAAEGGTLPLRIQLPSTCPMCIGTGRVLPFVCPACGGKGTLGKTVHLRFKIPPGIRDGAVLKGLVSFDSGEVVVRINVRVGDPR